MTRPPMKSWLQKMVPWLIFLESWTPLSRFLWMSGWKQELCCELAEEFVVQWLQHLASWVDHHECGLGHSEEHDCIINPHEEVLSRTFDCNMCWRVRSLWHFPAGPWFCTHLDCYFSSTEFTQLAARTEFCKGEVTADDEKAFTRAVRELTKSLTDFVVESSAMLTRRTWNSRTLDVLNTQKKNTQHHEPWAVLFLLYHSNRIN